MENAKVAEFVGKFTFGDLMRHLASIERWMFAENAMRRPSRYPGHGNVILSISEGSQVTHLEILRRLRGSG